MGHEFLGVIEETGAEVSEVKAGDVVVAPFVWADNTCDFCRAGLQPSCRHGGQWGCDDAPPLVRGGVPRTGLCATRFTGPSFGGFILVSGTTRLGCSDRPGPRRVRSSTPCVERTDVQGEDDDGRKAEPYRVSGPKYPPHTATADRVQCRDLVRDLRRNGSTLAADRCPRRSARVRTRRHPCPCHRRRRPIGLGALGRRRGRHRRDRTAARRTTGPSMPRDRCGG